MMSKIYSVMIMVLLISCSGADPVLPVPDGEYQATFTVEYNSGDVDTNPVTLRFFGKKYSSTSGPGKIPAGGSGTFQVTDESVIFSDVNIWTAEFDWNLILTGEYVFSESKTELILRKELENYATYTYRLIKDVR